MSLQSLFRSCLFRLSLLSSDSRAFNFPADLAVNGPDDFMGWTRRLFHPRQ